MPQPINDGQKFVGSSGIVFLKQWNLVTMDLILGNMGFWVKCVLLPKIKEA